MKEGEHLNWLLAPHTNSYHFHLTMVWQLSSKCHSMNLSLQNLFSFQTCIGCAMELNLGLPRNNSSLVVRVGPKPMTSRFQCNCNVLTTQLCCCPLIFHFISILSVTNSRITFSCCSSRHCYQWSLYYCYWCSCVLFPLLYWCK